MIPQAVAAGRMVALTLAPFAGRRVRGKPAPNRTPQSDFFAAIDAYLERQLALLHVPGATFAIVEGNKIVHLHSFGKARPGGEATTAQTPFAVGSLTKSITALAVMQLVEAGEVELDAPVQRYLPWFRVADPQASAEITVRHLLNQTSGLPQSAGLRPLTDLDDRPGAGARQARSLSTLKLTRPVGAVWEYSNMNYNLLGLIVAAVSGESYGDYIQNHIFTPLEMTHSYTSQAQAQQNGMAVGSRYWFAIPVTAPNLRLPRGSLPSGQLISGAEDMAHYLIAQVNEGRYGDVQLLSPAGIAELHRPAMAARAMGLSFGHYGMGWFTEVIGRTRIVSHSGTQPHFFAYMALLPEQKKGVILLLNANHLIMDRLVFMRVGADVAALLAGDEPVPSRFGAAMPWALRSLLLVPVLQLAGVVATVRMLRRWHRDPTSRPSRGAILRRHILLPLLPDVLVTLPLLGMLWSGALNVMLLFMPDITWLSLACGSGALAWLVPRTGLVLRIVCKPPAA
ncbi:MAG: serine hydrolase domain-containing protein [Thermomicrobiales bacterium]